MLTTSEDETESDLEEINEMEIVEIFRDQLKPIELLLPHYCVHLTKITSTNLPRHILSLWRTRISRTSFIIFGISNLSGTSHF